MPSVIRVPPRWAVEFIIMVPSDYVLKDRFGVAQDESTFLQRVENGLLIGRQWYHDITGGSTFECVPTIYFRSAKSTAEMFATYRIYYDACLGVLAEMASVGLFDLTSRHRLPGMWMPLEMEGAPFVALAIGSQGYGCPFLTPGAAVSAGAAVKRLGGMFAEFVSTPTTVSAASAGATTLTVAAGMGRSFATAAKFHRYSDRVFAGPASPTGGTDLVTSDRGWCDVPPFDAVVWPYGPDNKPSPANAECILVTAVVPDPNSSNATLTIVRGRYGTTPIPIVGGGSNGATVIARRVKSARIWTSPATPEGTGAEVVQVDSISGDTLTVQRGKDDAYFKGGTTARAILAGDNIAVTEPYELNYYQNQTQAVGAAMHELGHCFGLKWWNAAECAAFDRVDGTGAILTEDVRGRYTPNPVTADTYDKFGFWQHLPHTPDNPLTDPADRFGPFVMGPGFPFTPGGPAAPAAGFTADELARVLISPYITAQARPTQANVVTAASIQSAGAAAGAPPKVQPLAWWASDTASSTDVFPAAAGFTVPFPSSGFLQKIDANMLPVRQFFWDKLDGYTFDVVPAVPYTSPKTMAELADSTANPLYIGRNLIAQGMLDAAAAGVVDLADVKRLPFMVVPHDNPAQDAPGAIGQTWCSRFFGPGHPSDTTGVPPFVCTIWGQRLGAGGTQVSGALASYAGSETSTPPSTGAAQTEAVQVVIAHELCHAFGYDPQAQRLLPHSAAWPASDYYDLMLAAPAVTRLSGPGSPANFTATQKSLLKASPFLTLHATRPT